MMNLGSGSSGNCTLIEAQAGQERRRLFVDCGFSIRRTRTHLESIGVTLDSIDAVILTHLDRDHFNPSWIATLQRLQIPIHIASCHESKARAAGISPSSCRIFEDRIDLGAGLVAIPMTLAHDDTGCSAYRFEFHEHSIGFATDLGHVPEPLLQHFNDVDVLAFESNYDRSMQIESDRPDFLKQRIMNGSGHLSNEQSLHAIRHIAGLSSLSAILLLHLSRQCNAPERIHELYTACAPELLDRLVLAEQFNPTPWIECGNQAPSESTSLTPSS